MTMTKLIKSHYPWEMGDIFFKDILDEAFKDPFELLRSSGFPPVDTFVEDGQTVFQFALAGYKPEDLTVEILGDDLSVSCKTEDSSDAPRRRIAKRSFSEKVRLPGDKLDLSKTQASFVDGILEIKIPHKDVALARKVEIKTNTVK